ncbi:hypothetical protein [Rickettsia endosymbiont of Ceutorhynchus obstrictus]|uniref:hypothetical protein n=1 Tax=Rickettsia endosymbiont of Ceutorhynchus obstrictus TaxID=3066249 RepID=UPI00313325B9
MIKNYSSKNYKLFDKYLNKISASTIDKFGSRDNIVIFLQELCEIGNIGLAAKKVIVGSPIHLHKLIHDDKYLTKCVSLALRYASERAEAVLYDRAINGYEELTYNEQGECIARKKKYCSRSLLEYLKANSPKYQTNIKNVSEIKKPDNMQINSNDMDIFEIEAYRAEAENEEEANN